MTTFKEQLILDNATFFNDEEFAETITYNGSEITAVIDDGRQLESGVPGFYIPGLSILVQAADVSKPQVGDEVTIDSVDYRVAGSPERVGGGVFFVSLEGQPSKTITV